MNWENESEDERTLRISKLVVTEFEEAKKDLKDLLDFQEIFKRNYSVVSLNSDFKGDGASQKDRAISALSASLIDYQSRLTTAVLLNLKGAGFFDEEF